ncbi:SDR family oxidoreductase [Pedobacter aquatilis]|uniref:SDR family NAD(P)-dependent oxidoreductase n=1 Tax=Pedobacter aquatilis TaxID=351343 RepID=UPI002930DCD1|nr:SDR family oxidoreductase [Pedobacter aquatilis]
MKKNTAFALITGATSGIGLELARLFAKDKKNLIIVARDEQKLKAVASELEKEGIEVVIASLDLFRPGAAEDLYTHIKGLSLPVDMLVNDAGQGVYGKFVETQLDRELDIIQLNISSLVTLTKYFAQDMVKNGFGRILNLASVAGKAPGPYQAVYHGTKAFVHSFTEAIRVELKDTGVSVTSLLPGATDTDFFRKADMLESKVVQEGELADPAIVAGDGYQAMIAGKDMVVSGFKNKVQVALGNITPDSIQAEQMAKVQRPVDTEKH